MDSLTPSEGAHGMVGGHVVASFATTMCKALKYRLYPTKP
jgi:hypothetical protein